MSGIHPVYTPPPRAMLLGLILALVPWSLIFLAFYAWCTP